MAERSPGVRAFWQAYREHAGLDHDRYTVVAFGDTPELQTALVELAVAGRKRATASLARDYGPGREPLPAVGDLVVVVDGSGAPRLIWCTTEIEVKPLCRVDDAFAWDEGEGDRTRSSWLNDHRRCFTRQATREGFAIHDDIAVVFERFRVVWPQP